MRNIVDSRTAKLSNLEKEINQKKNEFFNMGGKVHKQEKSERKRPTDNTASPHKEKVKKIFT